MTASPNFQIASLYGCYVAAGFFWGVLAASAPALQLGAALSDAQWGFVMGAMALAAFPVMRSFGRQLHRFEKHAIPACLVVFVVGSLVFCFSQWRLALVIAVLLTGAASGALDIALNNRTARLEEDTGARLFNRMHAVFPAAMLVASAATGALRDAGVPVWMLFAGVAATFAAFIVIEGRAGAHMRPKPATSAPLPGSTLRGVVLVLAAIAALGAFQEASSHAWAAIYVERVREAGPTIAGLAAAAFTLGLTAGRLLAHEVESRLSAMGTVRIAALVAIPSFLILAMSAPEAVMLLAFFLAGCGVGPIEPAVFRAVSRRSDGPERGRVLASVTAVAYLGYLISPPALGLVAQYLGWTALWALAAALAACVFALTARVAAAR